MSYDNCVKFSTDFVKPGVVLKEHQRRVLETVFEGNDCVAVLPTGYGKSLLFQLTPWMLGRKYGRDDLITIIVGPVNSIMEDQVRSLCEAGIPSCFISITGDVGSTFERSVVEAESSEDEECTEGNIRKYDKLDNLIEPLFAQLSAELSSFPVTIVYEDNLESIAYYYKYVEYALGDRAYVNEFKIPETRIFAQFHKSYTPKMKSHIISELRKKKPVLRLVFATVSLGMGLDAPSIERIIHFRPPTSLENYFQAVGRAGRNGQKAKAILYFNNSDIAKNRPGMQESMINYCKNTVECKRKLLLSHFGFIDKHFSGDLSDCCSFCKNNS